MDTFRLGWQIPEPAHLKCYESRPNWYMRTKWEEVLRGLVVKDMQIWVSFLFSYVLYGDSMTGMHPPQLLGGRASVRRLLPWITFCLDCNISNKSEFTFTYFGTELTWFEVGKRRFRFGWHTEFRLCWCAQLQCVTSVLHHLADFKMSFGFYPSTLSISPTHVLCLVAAFGSLLR